MHTLKTTLIDFIDDNCTTMGAALAYYTLFALPSLLLVMISLAGLVVGRQEVQNRIQTEIQRMAGGEAGTQVGTMVQHTTVNSASGILPTVLGLLALLYGATTAFSQLHSALNTIWRVQPDPNRSGIVNFVKDRFFSFLMVIGIAVLFLAWLVLNTAVSNASGSLTSWLPSEISETALHGIEVAVSFIVFTFLFGAIFKVLPDADLDWRQVRAGAIATALLFTIGEWLIGLYLGRQGAASAYGQAGSLVLIVLWVYYSALIILFGAEFTRVWLEAHTGPIEPDRGAIRAQGPAAAH